MRKQIQGCKWTRAIVITLAFLLVFQCGWITNDGIALAATAKDEYIIITENSTAAQKVKNDHAVITENGEALTAELSAVEAEQLEKEKDIICVEKDSLIVSPVEVGWDMVKPAAEKWNLQAINAQNVNVPAKVKVAIIDSGVDYSNNVEVYKRKNFIADKPVTTEFYEDLTGHGTSVASLLAGKQDDSNVQGTNDNIQLYSARVLDENNQGTISSVVEAIFWAMENDVNIINISFGTPVYSEALKKAIDAAEEQGILIVAAVGNRGTEGVEYPAAVDNVLAVGSVNAAGEVSDFSGKGTEVDVVAPGEAVLAQCNFGDDLILSGTSLAAPQVSGIAAALWSKDLTKPAAFIKTLIKSSAKSLSDSGGGYGLVDYAYALEIYDDVAAELESVVEENEDGEMLKENSAKLEQPQKKVERDNAEHKKLTASYEFEEKLMEAVDYANIAPNSKSVEVLKDPYVDGSWGSGVHEAYSANAAMKAGAVFSDKEISGVKGMTSHSEFHGFSWHGTTDDGLNTGTCNYIANYKYLVLVANKVGNGDSYTSVTNSNVIGLSATCYGKLKSGVKSIIGTTAYTNNKTAADKKAFLMGVAMHTATDAFAHSAFQQMQAGSYSWRRITHTNDAADKTSVVPRRAEMAYAVEKNVIARFKGNRSGEKIGNDFHDDTGACYKLAIGFRQNKLMTFAQAADVTKATIISDFKLVQTGAR